VPPYPIGSATPHASERDPARTARHAQRLAGARNLAAGTAVAAVVVQLAVAQVTLALAIAFVVIAALSRWRPAWMLGPVLVGLGWSAVIGTGRAWAGYLGAACHLVAFLTAQGTMARHLGGMGAVAADWQRWLPAQMPFALIAAGAEAGAITRLAGRRRCRPGLVVAVRRRYVLASLRRGELATADGACLGVVTGTGRRATISWRESRGGVLVTGQDAAAVTRTGLDLAIAAILHRKAVLIVDLTDGLIRDGRDGRGVAAATSAAVLRRVTAACADVAAPLAVFGSGGACYDPLSGVGPAMATSLLLSMIDWGEGGQARRGFCADYVRSALEVIASRSAAAGASAAGSAVAGRPHNTLDEMAALLRPGALQAQVGRQDRGPGDPPLRREVAVLASQPHAEPSATAGLAEQLARLRRSASGAALCAPSNGAKSIDIGLAIARRQVVLFPLDLRVHGPAGLMIARLVVADVSRTLSERSGAPADYLLWINGCDALDESTVAGAIARGSEAVATTIVCTASGTTAGALASQVNVAVVRGSEPGVPGEVLLCHHDSEVLPAAPQAADRADALAVRVCGPVPRLMTGCRVAR
jgi:hypothetical protein